MCKIWRWRFKRNASYAFSSHESNVKVSAAYNKTDITWDLVPANLGTQLENLVSPYPTQRGHDYGAAMRGIAMLSMLSVRL